MAKDVILTGIRANNDLHIGNYFGALLPMVDMATSHSEQYQINLFVPDLHSFTTAIDHSQLQAQIIHNLKIFAAAGLALDNPNIYIYRQSYIPAHSELTWILDCFTGFGEMSRMTQFKDKSEGQANVSLGLFNYPVLMAADILLYGAKYVPVGDDQTQHLEFTRDIAQRLNKQFGELFVVPEPVAKQHELFGKDQGLRIRDLIDPSKKMSKTTNSDKGVIFLGDDPELAYKKIRAATTDSERLVGSSPDPHSRAGIFNLIQIYKLLKPDDAYDFSQETYDEFKDRVGTAVMDFLTAFQEKLDTVSEQSILHKLEASEREMNQIAGQTLLKVQRAVGLRPKL